MTLRADWWHQKWAAKVPQMTWPSSSNLPAVGSVVGEGVVGGDFERKDVEVGPWVLSYLDT